jgi:hypothetical protein
MLQPDSMLPAVARCPAPWNLRGTAWIVALKLPPGAPARDAFLPPGLAGQGRGLAAYLMYVDYVQSDCGPYRELLFIPGAFPFGDGRRHLTISRIVVSTWDSVVNGRENWGIPKDRADFEVEQGLDGGREDRVRVLSEGRELCELRLATLRFAPSLPVPGGLLPARLRTLAQSFRGRTYYYAPAAAGRARPGRLLSWRFDAELFPDLAAAPVLAAFKIESFRMTFPVADVAG